jgi:tripartite-type tricarboxylate transporter receptor subunit TctC
MIDRRLLVCAGLAAGTMAAARGVRAEAYPSRTVHLVVPFSAGGTTDFVTSSAPPA